MLNEDIPIFNVYITSLKYMPKASNTVYLSNIRVLHFYHYMCGQFNKIIMQRYDIFTSCLKNYDMGRLLIGLVGQ